MPPISVLLQLFTWTRCWVRASGGADAFLAHGTSRESLGTSRCSPAALLLHCALHSWAPTPPHHLHLELHSRFSTKLLSEINLAESEKTAGACWRLFLCRQIIGQNLFQINLPKPAWPRQWVPKAEILGCRGRGGEGISRERGGCGTRASSRLDPGMSRPRAINI